MGALSPTCLPSLLARTGSSGSTAHLIRSLSPSLSTCHRTLGLLFNSGPHQPLQRIWRARKLHLRPLIQLPQHQQEQYQPSLRRRRSLPQPPRLKTTRSPEAAIQFGPHHRLGSATAGARAVAVARRQLLFATGSHLFGTGQTSPPPATAAPPFQAEAPPITLATQLGADSGPTATTSTRSSL